MECAVSGDGLRRPRKFQSIVRFESFNFFHLSVVVLLEVFSFQVEMISFEGFCIDGFDDDTLGVFLGFECTLIDCLSFDICLFGGEFAEMSPAVAISTHAGLLLMV